MAAWVVVGESCVVVVDFASRFSFCVGFIFSFPFIFSASREKYVAPCHITTKRLGEEKQSSFTSFKMSEIAMG